MKRFQGVSGAAGNALFVAVAVCLAVTARAQVYSTNFDGTDTVNGAPATGFTAYTSPNRPVDNLDGQNNWASTDPLPATGQNGTATQINGGADYVGSFGSFFGGTFVGAIGGNQRSASPTGSVPDVVPSTASGGNITLYHPITVPAATSSLIIDVDLALTSPVTFTGRDSFSFSLQNTAGTASLMSLNFVPNADFTDPMSGQTVRSDNVTATVGTAANQTTSTALILSSQYHLHLVLTSGANGTYAGKFTDPSSGTTYGFFGGNLNTAPITLANVGRFAAGWSVTSPTITGGGYTGAGDNTLVFDNLVISAVPEPATYTLAAFGLLGLLCAARVRRQRA